MLRRLPPLKALRAFESAARSESFTRAAEELCVTQAAVSQQVKALEATLGIKLFNRERQRLVITSAGREYLAVIRDALDRIAVGTERVVQRRSSGKLTVSTSPDFAAKWLVYRLSRFAEAYPGIELRVFATMQYVDFVREEIDLAVRHGDGTWVGLDAARLCSERLFPVCSPSSFPGAIAWSSHRTSSGFRSCISRTAKHGRGGWMPLGSLMPTCLTVRFSIGRAC
jgi:LysR family glycine cleavage system transcriptional activator